MKRRVVTAMRFAVMVAVLLPGTAQAQAQAPAAPAADATLFQRGLDRYDARDYAGAVQAWEKLVASSGEDRAWRALYNLGLAYQASGDATRAVERFERFVRRVGEQPGNLAPDLDERRQDALDRIAELKRLLGAVRVLPPPNGEVVPVRIDDGPPRPAGFTAYLTPGRHFVDIADGERARRFAVDVTAGGMQDLTATPKELGPTTRAARPPPGTPDAEAASFPTMVVIVGAAAAVASLAFPIAMRARATSKREDAEALGAGHTKYPEAVDDYDSARTAYYVSYAAPIALGAVTLGIVIANVGRGAKRAGVSGLIAPGRGGLRAEGWF